MRRNFILITGIIMFSITACNFNTDSITPTIESDITEEAITPQVIVSPSLEPTPTPTQTAVEIINVSTPSPSPTPLPTETLPPTATPGPWEYIIQEDDTLGYIIQLAPHNYPFDLAVINAVVQLNENIFSADSLPPPGSSILIPRPTATPVTTGNGTIPITNANEHPEIRGLPANTEFGCHTVKAKETIIGIAERYATTLEILSQLNRETISFAGCNFELPSGGPNCNPLIGEGQCVQVPFPTPTPTLSPTPSGEETPTLTPTYAVPKPVFPPNGGIAPATTITLQWVSIGILQPDEFYLVQVKDLSGETQPFVDVTKNTTYQLPESLIPSDGQIHTFEWSIMVARNNQQGIYESISGAGLTQIFQWQSR